MSATQRWLLREQLHKFSDLDDAIGRLDAEIADLCLPFARVLALLDQIPGVNQCIARDRGRNRPGHEPVPDRSTVGVVGRNVSGQPR
jgi:hypothetical protein